MSITKNKKEDVKLLMKKMFLSICLLWTVACLSCTGAMADGIPDYDYTFKVKGLNKGDTCLIAYYLGTKQYIKDTLLAGANGTVRYIAEEGEEIDGGIYLFVLPGMNYFEFIVTEPSFTLETDIGDLTGKMKVKGSEENRVFFDYLRHIARKSKEAEALKSDPEGNKAKLEALDKEVRQFKLDFINDHPNTFISKVFRASQEPQIPEDAPKDEKGNPDQAWVLQYFRAHYWDGVDFSDERLLNTPVLHGKVKDFLNKYTYQHPDSIIRSVDIILEKAEANDEVFKFCTITCMNMYAGTKKMCFDKIYVHIAGKYYVSGKAQWVDSTQMSKIKDRYYKMMYNTCDRKAVNLAMQDMEGKPRQLYDVDAKYTVLIFWAYDCGHCKKELPKMRHFYEDYKKHGVEIFAVSTKDDLEKWKNFVHDKQIGDWIHVADPEHKTNFRIFYDIYSTPVIYLLDENKQIVAKRLDENGLRQYLNHELDLDIPIPGGEKGEKDENEG